MSNIYSFISLLICSFAEIGTLQAQTNYWQQMDFPQQYGGSIMTLHVSPSGTIFAGTVLDGLVRSTDNGETWKQVLQYRGGIPLLASSSTNSVFCSAGDGGGLYRSTDDGKSWSPVAPNGAYIAIRGLAITNLGQILISDATFGVYRSSDNGDTWTLKTNGLPGSITPSEIALSHIGSNEILFLIVQDLVSNQSTLYRSTNNGDLWTELISLSNIGNLFVHSNGFIFFKGPGGLMRSTTNGDSWQLTGGSSSYNTQGMISLPNGDIWSGNNYGFPEWGTPLLRSTDNGRTWGGFDTLGTGSIYSFAQSRNGTIFMGTEHTGLFKTTDKGLTWLQANTGFPNATAEVTSIVGTPSGLMSAGTTKFGSFISTDFGVSWTRNYPGHYTSITRIVIHPGGEILAGTGDTYFPYLQFSADFGNHWKNNGNFASDVAIDDKGNIYSCSQFSGVRKSTDIGNTWTSLPCPGTIFSRMHVARTGTIMVLTPYDQESPYRRYYYTRTSTDGGSTWIQSSPGNDQTQTYEYTSTSNNFLFAGTQTGIYRSRDSGQTWEATGLTLPAVRSLAANSSDVIFAGTDSNGVLCSRDYGVSWESYNAGLTDTIIMSLSCDANGYLFAGTYNKGIFRTVERTTSADHWRDLSPVTFALHQNYPNPFNPSTKIKFQIPRSSLVTLKVFDILGKEVATLVNEELNPGNYEKTLNAGGLASGVYLYRLTAGTFTLTRKLLLLR